MMPDNVLSTTPVGGRFLTPNRYDKLIDYEWGANDLFDTTSGLLSKLWYSKYEDEKVIIYNDSVSHVILELDGIESISFAFDYSMQWFLTYVRNGETFLMWYNSATNQHELINYGADYKTPQISLDDHRVENSVNSDIIFAYIKNGILYTRQQRDRYLIEYEHTFYDELVQIGMMTNYRFGFAAKSINVYNYSYDLSIIAPRNKYESKRSLDLMPEMPQSLTFGDNVIRNEGTEFAVFGAGKKNLVNTVAISFLLDESDLDYLMCFYRVWQHSLMPFYAQIVLDNRAPEWYKCHFTPDSVSLSTVGCMYRVSCSFDVIDKRYNKQDYKALARSRN